MKILPSWLLLPFWRDTDDSTKLGTIWIGPDASLVKSDSREGERLRICFRNLTDQTVLLCWMSPDGTPHHFYPLHPTQQKSGVCWRRLIVTAEDHIETTQAGHAFLILASPDPEATAQNKTLDGCTLVGAYRGDMTPEEGDRPVIHLVTIRRHRRQQDNSNCWTPFSRSPCPAFVRRHADGKKTDDTDDGDDDDSWSLSVRRARIDPKPLDTTSKAYTKLSLANDWPVYYDGDWDETTEFASTFSQDLTLALQYLPAAARHRLCQTTPLWINQSLQYGPAACPIPGKGMCFHPGKSWLVENGLTPHKCRGIEMYNTSDYLSSRLLWQPAGVLVHELSHAYHNICVAGGYGIDKFCSATEPPWRRGCTSASPYTDRRDPPPRRMPARMPWRYECKSELAVQVGFF